MSRLFTGTAPSSDANLVVTDVSTNNVSTSAHGFAPKVTDTAKFLKGDGTWATPIAASPDLNPDQIQPSANETIAAATAVYIPESYEVIDTFSLTIADTGVLEIG